MTDDRCHAEQDKLTEAQARLSQIQAWLEQLRKEYADLQATLTA
jgi:hypothetical protein